jgi:DNA-binding response OmpR family regulator
MPRASGESVLQGSHRLSRILIADEEGDSLEKLSEEFEVHGLQLVMAQSSLDLDEIARVRPDLLIIDRNLLGAHAFELCKGVRNDSRLDHLPVLMTGEGDEADRVIALELGADDYLSKPYSYREMMARVKALLRRVQFTIGTLRPIEIGELRIDPSSYQVTREGKPIQLTTLEFRLLHFLASQPNRMFSRDQLLEHVWGTKQVVIRRNVDTHISRLRKRIELNPNDPVHLKSLRGVGYMFEIREI